jgi:three-Cys-motif partner protein
LELKILSDNLPPIWEAKAHTIAKHQILEAYLNAWMPILARLLGSSNIPNKRLLVVDGFAGPGSYTGGQDGSPILTLKLVLSHSHEFNVPVRFLFIEEIRMRYDMLCKEVEKYEKQLAESPRIESHLEMCGSCEIVLNKYIDKLFKSGENLGPAFFFLDQFGFTDISMDLVRKIMSQSMCEVFSYLNWDHLNRFLQDNTKWNSITKTFGGEEWKGVFEIEPKNRARFIRERYKCDIKTKANCKYVWDFAMCDENDMLLYWLFFCTNNIRGLELMKKAMWKVDQTGTFRFSDKNDPSQLRLFEKYNDNLCAEELTQNLKSKTLTLEQIKEYVLTETPAYLYKPALVILEKKQLIKIHNPPAKRRMGTFADENMKIEFLKEIRETDTLF